jgi:hypothetical protein
MIETPAGVLKRLRFTARLFTRQDIPFLERFEDDFQPLSEVFEVTRYAFGSDDCVLADLLEPCFLYFV